VDNAQFMDVNNIAMFITNTGSFAWDKTSGNAGLEFPKGTGKTAVFAAGLWIGGQVGGSTRVAVSEYSDEYGPGAMVGGVADDPTKAEYKVYKLFKTYTDTAVRDAALADYNAGAVPHGAPAVTVQGDGLAQHPRRRDDVGRLQRRRSGQPHEPRRLDGPTRRGGAGRPRSRSTARGRSATRSSSSTSCSTRARTPSTTCSFRSGPTRMTATPATTSRAATPR